MDLPTPLGQLRDGRARVPDRGPPPAARTTAVPRTDHRERAPPTSRHGTRFMFGSLRRRRAQPGVSSGSPGVFKRVRARFALCTSAGYSEKQRRRPCRRSAPTLRSNWEIRYCHVLPCSGTTQASSAVDDSHMLSDPTITALQRSLRARRPVNGCRQQLAVRELRRRSLEWWDREQQQREATHGPRHCQVMPQRVNKQQQNPIGTASGTSIVSRLDRQ